MQNLENRQLIRFYQILIACQALLVLSSCLMIVESGQWTPSLICIGANLLLGVWNVTALRDLGRDRREDRNREEGSGWD